MSMGSILHLTLKLCMIYVGLLYIYLYYGFGAQFILDKTLVIKLSLLT